MDQLQKETEGTEIKNFFPFDAVQHAIANRATAVVFLHNLSKSNITLSYNNITK